ncbi:MAG: creatininase family protein [Sulfolobales archaeon]
MRSIRDMSWIDFERECYKTGECVGILPIGSVEQHGAHLPLGTDIMIAERLAQKIFEKASEKGFKIILLEPISITVSVEWSGNPGTLWVPGEVFQSYVKSYILSLMRNNIRRIIVLNAHGGNTGHLQALLKDVVYEFKEEGFKIYLINWWEFVGDVINRIFETRFFHADEVETSLAMALGIGGKATESGEIIERPYDEKWHDLDTTKRPRVYFFYREGRRLEKGSFGRPDIASREKGEILLKEFLDRFMDFLEDLVRGRI